MINIVADSCEAEIAFCIPPGFTAKDARRALKKVIKNSRVKDVELEELGEAVIDPTFTDPNHTLIQSLKSNIRLITKKRPLVCIQPSTSDGNIFRSYGVPTCWYGLGSLSTAHTYFEYVEKSKIIESAKIYSGVVIDYLIE